MHGRAEVVAERPLTIYDGAHNPAGARALGESLDDVLGERRPRVAVIGVLEDKDAAGMLAELLPRVDRAVYTRSQNPRSLSPATLGSLAEQLGGPPAETVLDPRAAVARARELAGPDGRGGGDRVDLPDRGSGAQRARTPAPRCSSPGRAYPSGSVCHDGAAWTATAHGSAR